MSLQVHLGERSYPIIIKSGCLTSHPLLATLVRDKKVCVVSNETIAPLYLDKLLQNLGQQPESVVMLPDGEQYKFMPSIEAILDAAIENKLNRSSIMIALGGGVIGDITGFAAACYQRGIEFIQVPTTLLSQVDSSVGGKTGINHRLGKNMIGAFHQPRAVFIDIDTLATLPQRELSAGMAEVIKYGLISDAEFFTWLEHNINRLMNCEPEALMYAIERSCEAKAVIVAQDERESGIRAILNLGHTFGHAIETHAGYGQWLHGEAVAVGMMMAIDLSVRQGDIDCRVLERTRALLKKAKLPVEAPSDMGLEQFLETMAIDKKNVHGTIRLVLLKSLGQAYVSDDYDAELMYQVIRDN